MRAKYFLYPGNKWLKHQILSQTPEFTPHLPKTERLGKQSFFYFVSEHPTVFVKPNIGGGGRGVIKIHSQQGLYCAHIGRKKKYFKRLIHMQRYIRRHMKKKKRYLIQEGIPLLTLENRPVDFRVLLLKINREWKYIGTMGKWGRKNAVVTNYCRGGKPVTLQQALEKGFGCTPEQCAEWEEKIRQFSLQAAKALNRELPRINQLGLDIAIDTNQHFWVLEANTKPNYRLFKFHDNPRLFRKIRVHIHSLRRSG